MSFECERVGIDFFDHAPVCVEVERLLPATPERLFEVLADPDSWPVWVFAIRSVTWTSPLPVRLGSTRTVAMKGGLVGDEEFIAFEPGRRMSFRFNQTNRKVVAAFAEDYRVTDNGNGTCLLNWRMAITPTGFARRTMGPATPVMRWFLARTLGDLARYLATHPSPSGITTDRDRVGR